jgi:hypothetical protein
LATYPVYNKVTGEQKEVTMSVHEWDKWKEENDQWIRDWSDPSTAPNSCETGEWKDKLIKKHPGWNEILDKASRAPKSRVKKI